jgi:hypothetical protein
VLCESHQELGISEDEWVLLVETLGSINCIQSLVFSCIVGSRDFYPLQAVADAVNNAQSLCKLRIHLDGETFPRDSSGLTALGSAFREHTGLKEFAWWERCHLPEAGQSTALDSMLWTLSACPYLQQVAIATTFASADAIRNLLQLPTDVILRLILTPDNVLAVADEIRQGRC